MTDYSVELCGLTFKNPLIAASGTFAFGYEIEKYYDLSKLGGISVKAITLEKRMGNPTPRIAETASGILNSVGLQNPGVDAFLEKELPRLKGYRTNIIANVAGSTLEEYIAVVEKLKGSGIDMIELNISCPNVKQGGMAFGTDASYAKMITQKIKDIADVPVMVKLTPNVTDIAAIAKAVEEGGADAISLINTVNAMAIDCKTKKPILAQVTGGLSGPAIKPIALRQVWEVKKAVSIPIVGMGGIVNGCDVAEFMLAGSHAVMVGTANLIDPTACEDILLDFENYCHQMGVSKMDDLIDALIL